MRRIVILTSATGAGHDAVAQSIAASVAEAAGDSTSVAIVDPLAARGWPLLGRLSHLYEPLIVRCPSLWGGLFALTDSPSASRLMRYVAQRAWAASFEAMLEEYAPSVLVSVHPLCTQVAAGCLRGRPGAPPMVAVVTDLGKAHSAWVAPGVSLYCVPTVEAWQSLVGRGVESAHIQVTGLPLGREYGHFRRSGDEGGDPVLLITGGGAGAGQMLALVRAVSDARLPLRVLVACGHNWRLRQLVKRGHWTVPVDALGYTRDMPRLMSQADYVVGKAGALTIGEAAVVGVPLVLLAPLPGQEAANALVARRRGIAVQAYSPDDATRILGDWLRQAGAPSSLAETGQTLGWAAASARVAGLLLAECERRGTTDEH